jgi:four helix bundle protein
MIKSFKDLIAWQRAMQLVQEVYRLTSRFPKTERYGLISQMRRAAVSIPSNISEGYSRRTQAEFIRFLDVARGSANEVETQLLLSTNLGITTMPDAELALSLVQEVQRILRGLADKLHRSGRQAVRARQPVDGGAPNSELRAPNSELSSDN